MKRKKQNKMAKRLLTLVFSLGLIWAFMFAGFVQHLHTQPSPVMAGDGLAILTGGAGRIDEGFQLLSEGRGKRLLLSGVTQDLDIAVVLRDIGQNEDLMNCCVDAENVSTNTRTNVQEVLSWARENNFESIVLITSNYHMPRSLLLFAEADDSLLVIPHPVKSEISGLGLAAEFNKYLLSLARSWLTS